jgi:peptidoglycan/LPS O-acetylase OafA/YrhL
VTRLGYQPGLDGIRGVAIAAVVAFHAFGWPRDGYLGVDLFFVLSGFLITTLLLEEHRERGRVSLRAFYRRRALRLVPALVVLVAAVVAVAAVRFVVTGDHEGFRKAWVGGLSGVTYTSNLLLAFDPKQLPVSLSHLWSLAAEGQFYVVWPAVLLVVLRRRLALPLTVALIGLVLYRQVDLVLRDVPSWRYGFGPETRSSSILVGCLFALLATSTAARAKLRAWAPVGLILVGAMILLNLGPLLFVGPLVLFGLGAGTLVVAALEPGSLRTALSVPPLVFLGRISYSLYLWHLPILVALGANARGGLSRELAGVAVALVAAFLSYRFVEQPFLRRKRRLRLGPEAAVPAAAPALGTALP